MRKYLILLCLLLPCLAWARGIAFNEEMHGYAWHAGEYRQASVYLQITINDIDAWRRNPSYAARVTGSLVLQGLSSQAVTGTLQILPPAPNNDGRLLTYRINSAALQFVGVKHVHDDAGPDMLDDMTTLHGTFLASGQAMPTIDELLYSAAWSSELHFEWWKPAVVWDFTTSMNTIATPWYDELSVRLLFVLTIFGNLAQVFIPWAV
jgi:hypothetical protein